MSAATLHLVSDAAVSLAVAAAGLVILLSHGTYWLDPAVSLLVCVAIASQAVRLLHRSADVLLESTPKAIDPEAVLAAVRDVPTVVDVHDLHVWSLSSDLHAMSAHVAVSVIQPSSRPRRRGSGSRTWSQSVRDRARDDRDGMRSMSRARSVRARNHRVRQGVWTASLTGSQPVCRKCSRTRSMSAADGSSWVSSSMAAAMSADRHHRCRRFRARPRELVDSHPSLQQREQRDVVLSRYALGISLAHPRDDRLQEHGECHRLNFSADSAGIHDEVDPVSDRGQNHREAQPGDRHASAGSDDAILSVPSGGGI